MNPGNSKSRLVVEGPAALPSAAGGAADALTARRIEIDLESGLIDRVGAPQGTGNIVLGDDSVVLPGLIDVHVHAREDVGGTQAYKETFETAGRAALHGGVTAFAEMPNNPTPPVDDASYAAKRALADPTCPVDVLLYAGLGPTTEPLSHRVPYKAYMGQSVGDLFFESDHALHEALKRYRGQRVAFHAESPEILARCKHRATHQQRRPPEAEWRAVETALRLSADLGIDPHICHLSTARGFELIQEARGRGVAATCEVTPQHLFYDEDNAQSFARPSFLQCNPPLREPRDRATLLDAFIGGQIEYLGTDHAPHTLEENTKGVSGMPQLDTYGGFLAWLREQGASWRTLIQACSERPGEFLGSFLPRRFGRIETGYVGSLTILKLEPTVVERDQVQSRAGWSPFEGVAFPARVTHTIVRGVVFSQVE